MLETEKEKSMTRKEYLKYKKKKNRSLPWLKNIALLLVIVALSLYVVNQLKVYTSVTEIANKMLEESKLIKTYKMYFMGEPYTKDDKENILYYYQGADESRTEIKSGKGLKYIQLDEEGNIYGIKDKNLIKVNVSSDTSEIVVEGDVSNYLIYGKEVLVYKDYGKNSDKTGVYELNGEMLIKGVVYQMIRDLENVYFIQPDTTSKSLIAFSISNKSKKNLSGKDIVNNIIQDDDNIYYSSSSRKGYICKVSKSGGEAKVISHNSCLVDSYNFYTTSAMGVYGNKVIYINSEDNKVYLTGDNEDEVIVDNEVKQIQLKGNMLYFLLKDKIEIYRYNVEKNMLEKITSARTGEMICSNQ